MDKIEENSKYITNKRAGVTFRFSDTDAVDSWESERRTEGTPLMTFYNKWKSLRKENQRREMKQILGNIEEKKKRKREKDRRKGNPESGDEEDVGAEGGNQTKPNGKTSTDSKKKVNSRKKLKKNRSGPAVDSLHDIEVRGLVMSDEDD